MVKIGAAVAENGPGPHVAQQRSLRNTVHNDFSKGKNVILERSPQCSLTSLAPIFVRVPAPGPHRRVRPVDLNSVPCAHVRLCGFRRGVNFQPKMPKVLVFHVPRPFCLCVHQHICVLIASPCFSPQTLLWDLNLNSPFSLVLSCACFSVPFGRFSGSTRSHGCNECVCIKILTHAHHAHVCWRLPKLYSKGFTVLLLLGFTMNFSVQRPRANQVALFPRPRRFAIRLLLWMANFHAGTDIFPSSC